MVTPTEVFDNFFVGFVLTTGLTPNPMLVKGTRFIFEQLW